MRFGNKIRKLNPPVIKSEICWLPLMAFSAAVTADELFLEVQSYFDEWALRLAEEADNCVGYLNRLVERELMPVQEAWLERKASKTMAEFCVQGDFRSQSNLKSFCRAKIRETLIKAHGTKTTHSQLVKYVKLLGLPRKVEQFVLFNSTDYDL